mmetsp:Transcript_7226/g.10025  ORF Transcript_7226/g.10025 Transcript_7226/m.10025 type:complete len:665 (+) Transcript_7226:51-2045(+)
MNSGFKFNLPPLNPFGIDVKTKPRSKSDASPLTPNHSDFNGLDFNPESLTDKERASRELFNQKKSSKHPDSSTRIIEKFLVVGIPEEKCNSANNVFTENTVGNNKNINSRTQVSMPSASDELEPEILFEYPPNDTLNFPGIMYFCFPNGITPRKLKRTPSQSNLFALLCSQNELSPIQNAPNSYIFLLTTETKEILYGVCVRRDKVVDSNISKFSQTTKQTENISPDDKPLLSIHHSKTITSKTGNTIEVGASLVTKPKAKAQSFSPRSRKFQRQTASFTIAPRCYCIITRYPFFQLHFDTLYAILALEHVHDIERMPTSNNDNNSNTPPTQPLKDNLQQNTGLIQIDTDILELLDKYKNLQIPNRGQMIEIEIPTVIAHATTNSVTNLTTNTTTLRFSRNFGDEEEIAMCDWGVPMLFYMISYKQFFTLFSAFLLEKKILFLHPQVRVISAVVLAFIPLLRPFHYQSIMVPILPKKLASLLEAPVPFVAGATKLPRGFEVPYDVIIVNLQDRTIISKETVPPLPSFSQFEPEFKTLYNELIGTFSSEDSPKGRTGLVLPTFTPNSSNPNYPYVTTSKQLRLAIKISKLFERYLSSLFAAFQTFCIRDMTDKEHPITIFMKESFLESIPRQDHAWHNLFVETQMFFNWQSAKLIHLDKISREDV